MLTKLKPIEVLPGVLIVGLFPQQLLQKRSSFIAATEIDQHIGVVVANRRGSWGNLQSPMEELFSLLKQAEAQAT